MKFLRVQKTRLFPKKFQTSITELFRNFRKQKVWKIPSFAGPQQNEEFVKYCTYEFDFIWIIKNIDWTI